MRRNSGFTALDVAVTLAIVAVLASVTMPSFLNWLSAHRLRGSAINLMSDLEMAKIRAMRENTFVAVLFAADGYSIFVDNGEGAGTAGDWQHTGAERLIQERKLPAGVSIQVTDMIPADKRVRFTGRGLPEGLITVAVVPVENKTGRKDLRLNRLGRVWIQ
jgi:Tfp pilus assembly protein FimT